MPSDKLRSLALTFRPSGGVKFHHEGWLRAYLERYADQWEFYEETIDGDECTRHFHGRVLLKVDTRIDKAKVQLIRCLKSELAERKVLMSGIKFLYDDWEYARKDGNPVLGLTYLPDENKWVYADPHQKRVKRKNSRAEYHIALICEKLPSSRITTSVVEELLAPLVASGEVELPGSKAAWQNLLWQVSTYWNFKVDHPSVHPSDHDSDSDSDSDIF